MILKKARRYATRPNQVLSHTHARTCEECYQVRNTNKTEKNVRATRRTVLTLRRLQGNRYCLQAKLLETSANAQESCRVAHIGQAPVFPEPPSFRLQRLLPSQRASRPKMAPVLLSTGAAIKCSCFSFFTSVFLSTCRDRSCP